MSIRRVLPLIFAAVALFIAAGNGNAADSRTVGAGPLPAQAASGPVDPIGNAFQISNIASLAEIYPAVAYDSAHFEYLAVWYNDRTVNDDIMAQRLSKNGSLIGAPFYVSTGGTTIDRRYPQVAYNVRSDQFLVVWEQQDISSGYSIQGSRMTWNGVLLDTTPFSIRDYGINLYTPARPAVAYAYTSDKYLVVWEEVWHPIPITTNIYGQVVLSNGLLSGSLINIAQGDGGRTQSKADLAYNIDRNEYLVVWQQLDPGPSLTDIWSRRVTGDGAAQGAAPIVVAGYTKSTTSPAVASLPVPPDGQYLVVWEQNYSANDRDIMSRLVGSNGIPPAGDIPISVTNILDELQPDVAASPARNAYLVTWQEIPFPFTSIYARSVTPAGATDGESFNLGGITAGNPHLVAGWLGDFMMVYHDINFSFDWGTYGWLIGTRVHLPLVEK
jgi:hypothetical protein